MVKSTVAVCTRGLPLSSVEVAVMVTGTPEAARLIESVARVRLTGPLAVTVAGLTVAVTLIGCPVTLKAMLWVKPAVTETWNAIWPLCALPRLMVELAGERVKSAGGTCSVICALAETLASAALVAVIVSVAGLGRVEGAENKPLVLIVPSVGLPPAMPFTVQATAVLEVPVTVALNSWLVPRLMVALVGSTLTRMGWMKSTSALAARVGSWTEVAVTVTEAVPGGVAGAV